MTDQEREYLKQKLVEKYRWYNTGSKTWSAVHHWSLVVSAFSSALAVIALKLNVEGFDLDDDTRNNFAAILGAAATLITAISAAGNFGRKWQTNRISRGRVERLQIALSDPDANISAIRNELQELSSNMMKELLVQGYVEGKSKFDSGTFSLRWPVYFDALDDRDTWGIA